MKPARSFILAVGAGLLVPAVKDQASAQMMANGGAWMAEGSPARLLQDYNQLIDSYSRDSNSRGLVVRQVAADQPVRVQCLPGVEQMLAIGSRGYGSRSTCPTINP
jgi:hypothetical protein